MEKLKLLKDEFIYDGTDDFGYKERTYYLGGLAQDRYENLKKYYSIGKFISINDSGTIWHYEILGFLDDNTSIKLFEL